MTPDQIKTVLTAHKQWLNGDSTGKRADLHYAYLRDANLTGANLRYADLRYANLRGAILRGAILRGAYLTGANLSGANLRDGIKAKRLVGLATRGIDSYVFRCIETDSESDRFYYIAGCRSFTRQEFESHIESEYPDTEKASKTRACMDYLESLA